MQAIFRNRHLQKRLIALAAAYAIALAGLIANFGGAQMAAAAAIGLPSGIICHTDDASGPAPSSDNSGDKTCIDNCCTGCLMLSAALPEPPASAAILPQTVSEHIAPSATAVLVSSPQSFSHRSRAPPRVA